MDIYFSPYSLTPLKRANRLSSLDPKKGVYLKAVHQGKTVFADYYPHIPLGDRSVEIFLDKFKFQEEEYDRKVLHLLRKDAEYQGQGVVSFRNHQLWTGTEPLEARVIKYKLLSVRDTIFREVLESGRTLRLDGNGLFDNNSFQEFVSSIPAEFHKQIEYIEDPTREKNWNALPLPSARDFLEASGADFYIYKPNCEFHPGFDKINIFSAYLGSGLGSWHTYCSMLEEADLSFVHGIVAKGFYAEERGLFTGDYNAVVPDMNVVRNIYQELHIRNWKLLCSI